LLFIPGYALTWMFFPEKPDLPRGDRIALSFALSISGVMLSVLFADIILGIDSTPVNIVITVMSLTFLALLFWRIHLFIITRNINYRLLAAIRTFSSLVRKRFWVKYEEKP